MMTLLRIHLGLALVLALAAPASSQDLTGTDPSELEQAQSLLANGKPEEAIALVDPIIAKAMAGAAGESDALCPSVAVAVLAQFMDDPNISLRAENDWCDAMFVKGYALVELKRFDEASEVLGRLVRHNKSSAQYWSEYAFALRSQGRLDDALNAYRRAKSAASKYEHKAAKRHWRAVALRGIGFIAVERQDWDAAEKAYRDSLKDAPGNAIAEHELALIREKRAQ